MIDPHFTRKDIKRLFLGGEDGWKDDNNDPIKEYLFINLFWKNIY